VLLVAGGQLDPNVGCLLRRVLARGVDFRDLLVGPDLTPRIEMDVRSGTLCVDGERLDPTACLVRHDVFLHQNSGRGVDFAGALNWFYAVRGWAVSNREVRILNRHSYSSENNKIENLTLALQCGLKIPDTIVTNVFVGGDVTWIQKPVAGGSYTTTLASLVLDEEANKTPYPRFLQPKMHRPELRIYRIGSTLLGFAITSPELDYRVSRDAVIEAADVPAEVAAGLVVLCDALGLDFAAADFMHEADGELRFLEINTQPMFAAFDRVVGGKLTDAIIDHLLRPGT
jgi:hypothetical protein